MSFRLIFREYIDIQPCFEARLFDTIEKCRALANDDDRDFVIEKEDGRVIDHRINGNRKS